MCAQTSVCWAVWWERWVSWRCMTGRSGAQCVMTGGPPSTVCLSVEIWVTGTCCSRCFHREQKEMRKQKLSVFYFRLDFPDICLVMDLVFSMVIVSTAQGAKRPRWRRRPWDAVRTCPFYGMMFVVQRPWRQCSTVNVHQVLATVTMTRTCTVYVRLYRDQTRPRRRLPHSHQEVKARAGCTHQL